MKFGLRDDVMKQICEVFEKFPEVEEAVLFGSRATGSYRPGSDIDLALKGRGLTTSIAHRIFVRLGELPLTNMFNIGIYDLITDKELLDDIAQEGKSIYKKVSGDA